MSCMSLMRHTVALRLFVIHSFTYTHTHALILSHIHTVSGGGQTSGGGGGSLEVS